MECKSIWSVNLHGVRRHSTLCNIHMDTSMDMDMECIINHMVWRNFTIHNIHPKSVHTLKPVSMMLLAHWLLEANDLITLNMHKCA